MQGWFRRRNLLNAHTYNAVGVPGGQPLSKAVLYVAVVVLVRLGMDQNWVVEFGLAHERNVFLQ